MQGELDQQTRHCVSALDVAAVALIVLVGVLVVSLLVARQLDDVLLQGGFGPEPGVILHDQVPRFLPARKHANQVVESLEILE